MDTHGGSISGDKRGGAYVNMQSPRVAADASDAMADASPHQVRLRMRHRTSTGTDDTDKPVLSPDRLVSEVKKMMSLDVAPSAFWVNLQLAMRIAVGVLIAGVAQTRASSSSRRQYLLLPNWYFLGGLSWAANMVIYAAARNIGGALQQIWQIDIGVMISLAYNFAVFSLVPMTQENVVQSPLNVTGRQYVVSLLDWAKIVPLILGFTLVMFMAPLPANMKKFAVSTNLYFMLTVINPMNPKYPDQRKDLGDGSTFGTANVLKNYAIYCVVGFAGTLVALATMLLPSPRLAIRQLHEQISSTPKEIRQILNLVVDAYCFRARDIREMEFFRLKLDRLLESADARLKEMTKLLDNAVWEDRVFCGRFLHYNKVAAEHYVGMYAKFLKGLVSMKFAIELETCEWTHRYLMKNMQNNIYMLQAEMNDLLDEIARQVVSPTVNMPKSSFRALEQHLRELMVQYSQLYSSLLNEHVKTANDVGMSMPLNLFLYSVHELVDVAMAFERAFDEPKNPPVRGAKAIISDIVKGFQRKTYPKSLVVFSLRTTFGVLIGICCSTFLFAFSSTVPNAIAMVAQDNTGGTFGTTVSRVSGLVVGTVLPSIFSFFISMASNDVLYNTLNNSLLLLWTTLSMFIFYHGGIFKSAGAVSAYMAASVLLSHISRASGTFKPLSYSSLTENSLGILILMMTERILQTESARPVLRSKIHDYLQEYGACVSKICRHHLALSHWPSAMNGDTKLGILDETSLDQIRLSVQVTLPKILAEQATLLYEASLEPDFWRPPFSQPKYAQVLKVCQNLLTHLQILANSADWCNAFMLAKCDIRLPFKAPTTKGSKYDPAHPKSARVNDDVAARLMNWYRSQEESDSIISEAFTTLLTLFGKQFQYADPDDAALFLQMKEAFRLADVDRKGEVNAAELATLLEKLVPYSARGNLHVEQYVAEFLRLVDSNKDGKVSYGEFMDALNRGFRLELEIYEDLRGAGGVFRGKPKRSDGLSSSTADIDPESEEPRPRRRSADESFLEKVLHVPSKLLSPVFKHSASQPNTQGHSMDTLLNIESLSIKDAASKLQECYSECLLHPASETRIATHEFISMSCLLAAMNEIADNLTTLNTLAMS